MSKCAKERGGAQRPLAQGEEGEEEEEEGAYYPTTPPRLPVPAPFRDPDPRVCSLQFSAEAVWEAVCRGSLGSSLPKQFGKQFAEAVCRGSLG
eukprot:COSAG05_NODE_13344_length_433_cov_4.218563_1_plen_92_part_10